MLKATDLCFRYGSFELKNINLNIEKGTFTCICGSNGSGKSTLARLLGGALEPKNGSIECDALRGLVLSNPDNMFVNPTVEEDVAFGPENLGRTSEQIRQDVDRALELTGMTEYAKQRISTLSYGLKQRVAIAGALAMDARYLILDEVTSMLDRQGSDMILALILDLVKQGKAVVLVTHNTPRRICRFGCHHGQRKDCCKRQTSEDSEPEGADGQMCPQTALHYKNCRQTQTERLSDQFRGHNTGPA